MLWKYYYSVVAWLQVGQASRVFWCLGDVTAIAALGFLGTFPTLATWVLTTLKFVGVWLKYLQIFFGHLRQSSVIFGVLWKMFRNVCLAFRQILHDLWKSLESGQKSSENWYIHTVCCYLLWIFDKIKRTLYGLLMLKNISLIRYANSWNIFQHSKIIFLSPHGHVISCLFFLDFLR